jgi:hypothetical protein
MESMKYDRAVQPDNPPGMGIHFYGIYQIPASTFHIRKKMFKVMCIEKHPNPALPGFPQE